MRPIELDRMPPPDYPEEDILAANINLPANSKPLQADGTSYFTPANPYVLSNAAEACAALIDEWLSNKLGTTEEGNEVIRTFNATDDQENLQLNSQFNSLDSAFEKLGGYKYSRRTLINQIGHYCAYCETPLVSRLAIEHTLPKSWFPAYRFTWSNFLLCCPTCNSIKGSKPNQEIDNAYYTTAEAITKIGRDYAWPNEYWREASKLTAPSLPYSVAIHLLSKEMRDDDYKWKKAASATLLNNIAENLQSNRAAICRNTFRIFSKTVENPEKAGGEQPYGARILPAHGASDKADEMKRLIDLTDLNRVSKMTAGWTSDSRVANRTLTYFRALAIRNAFSDILNDVDAPDELQADLKAVVFKTAALSGFWSVWMTVFKDMASAQGALQVAFPGTAPVDWYL